MSELNADFLPANLFSDLNVPEVRVDIPPHADDVEEREEYLPIAQAMRMLAPGKVTRRFAFERGELNHWIPIPYDQSRCSLPVSAIAGSYEYVADVQAVVDGVATSLPCYRPLTMNLRQAPRVVRPTSNSFLEWQSELAVIGDATPLKTSAERGWYRVISDIDVYLHGFGTSIMVRRFATQARANLRLLRQDDDVNVEVRFSIDEQQAAIGFEHEVDGLRVAVAVPEPGELTRRSEGAASRQAWLAGYVRELVQTDEELSRLANPFQRDWLHQIYVAALVYESVQSECSLAQAADQIRNDSERVALAGAMQVIFRMDPEQDDEPDREQRLRTALLGLVRDARVLQRLEACARQLWDVDTERFGDWLRLRVHETLAEAVLSACTSVAIDHVSEDSLLLDLTRGAGADEATGEFWITESSLGGSGIVEAVAQAFTSDRRSFFRGVEAALAPSDLETTATNLEGFARLLIQDDEVASALGALRAAPNLAVRDQRHAEFQRTLVRKGIVCDHAFDVAIAHRYLRGGMSPKSDRLVAELLDDWDASQARTGCVIPLRVYCLLAARSAELKPRIERIVAAATGMQVEEWELASVLSGVLWPRAPEIRGKTFDRYSPFRTRGHTDPSLARELLFGDGVNPISLSEEGRVALLHKDLATNGVARLWSPVAEAEALTAELLRLVALPVDVEYLQFYPTVESVVISGTEITATILLRDWA